ncbi:protein kinase c [Moniliophthora roreri]|nr:protein kinase c [Moniliophthora roreri]
MTFHHKNPFSMKNLIKTIIFVVILGVTLASGNPTATRAAVTVVECIMDVELRVLGAIVSR